MILEFVKDSDERVQAKPPWQSQPSQSQSRLRASNLPCWYGLDSLSSHSYNPEAKFWSTIISSSGYYALEWLRRDGVHAEDVSSVSDDSHVLCANHGTSWNFVLE